MAHPRRSDPDISRVSSELVSDVLNMSRPIFLRHVRNSILPPQEEDTTKYDLRRCVHAWLKYLEYGRGNSIVFDAKRALLEEKFREAKMENELRERKLVEIDDVENTWVQSMATLASQLDSLPGRLSAELAGLSDQAVILQRLKHEILLARRSAQEHLQAFLGHPPRLRSTETPEDEDARRVGKRKARAAARKSRARSLEEQEDSLHDPDRKGLRKSLLSKSDRRNGQSNGKDRQSSQRDRSPSRRRSGPRLVRRADEK